MTLRTLLIFAVFCLLGPSVVFADAPPFDLSGPSLRVKVTHNGATLPISEVPNLSLGDRLSVKADLPAGQSVHYLLVVAFLRGATNPPPKSWFFQAQTWTKKGRDGLTLAVPQGAQQVLVFLAPQTGGDFDTLVDAVRGRPGAFVRASQDLNQAALDRSRLDFFLAAVRQQSPADPDRLKTVTPLLARSLTIKLNTDCFQKMPELQAACLMEGQDSLILDDGHSTTIVQALTTGNPADLALQLSATPQAGFGYYSPYIAAVADIARIMDGIRTARYQYIPALATARDDKLALLLNTPPSFHDPLSVLVTALPAVEAPQAPPLQPVDPSASYCAARTDLVLPVEGAPLVYSTHYAHDMVLHVSAKDGQTLDLPVTADAEKGGFIASASGVDLAKFGDVIDGDLRGDWGFEPFDGPRFQLQNTSAAPWRIVPDDQQSLIVGRDDIVRLQGQQAACVASVALQQSSGETKAVVWNASAPDTLTVTLPLTNARPGAVTLLVKQFGAPADDVVPLQVFAQAGRLDGFTLQAGDASGILKGSRLDEVAGLTLDGISFKPGVLTSADGGDALTLDASDAESVGKLTMGQSATAKVTLEDGRIVRLRVTVGAPRPKANLIGKSILPPHDSASVAVRLIGPDEAPQVARITFSVHAQAPMRFLEQDAIEVATLDGGVNTTLSAANGLTLEDAQVAVATLDPSKTLGPSAFGPLKFRVVQNGEAGDWQPLVTLVRLPVLQGLKCPQDMALPCELSGSNLFLIDAISSDPAFGRAIEVPQGFPGNVTRVPHPTDGRLYLKLHDDPQVINQITFPDGSYDKNAAPG